VGHCSRQVGILSLSFLSFFSYCISLVGHCSREAGVLSLLLSFFSYCISLMGHCSRQAGILSLLPVIRLLLYLTGGILQQTGRNTLSLSLSLFYCISLVDIAADRQEYSLSVCYSSSVSQFWDTLSLSPPCLSSTVSHWWNTKKDRQEYSLCSC
jgi:hypothetical protein